MHFLNTFFCSGLLWGYHCIDSLEGVFLHTVSMGAKVSMTMTNRFRVLDNALLLLRERVFNDLELNHPTGQSPSGSFLRPQDSFR